MEGSIHIGEVWHLLSAHPISFHILLHSPIHKAPSANVCYYPLVVNVAKLKVLLKTAPVKGPNLRLHSGLAANTIEIHPKNSFV